MSEHEDPTELADALEREAGQMGQQSERLQGSIEEARSDWEAKRADGNVPGAVPEDEPSPEPEDPANFPAKSDD